MPNDAMIQCENVTKRFGHVTAVDHVSLSVAKRSIFGFLGPNGSGKTTVIRLLCGILEPSEGRAQITCVNLGTVLSSAGRLPEAMAHLDEALRLKGLTWDAVKWAFTSTEAFYQPLWRSG